MLKTAGSGQISVGFQLRLGNSTCTIWSHLPTMTRLLRNICVSCFVYGGWLVGSEGCLRMGLQCRRVCEVPWVTPHWVPVASFGEGKSPVVFEAVSSSDRAILQFTESWRTCLSLPRNRGTICCCLCRAKGPHLRFTCCLKRALPFIKGFSFRYRTVLQTSSEVEKQRGLTVALFAEPWVCPANTWLTGLASWLELTACVCLKCCSNLLFLWAEERFLTLLA